MTNRGEASDASGADNNFRDRMAQFRYSTEQAGMPSSARMTRAAHLHSQSSKSPGNARPFDTSPSPGKRNREVEPNMVIKDEVADEDLGDLAGALRKIKRRRTTTKERSAQDPYNPENNLVDSLRPGLTLVCIGLNPGL
jgi:hypothetical protein